MFMSRLIDRWKLISWCLYQLAKEGGKSWTHPTQGWHAGVFLVPQMILGVTKIRRWTTHLFFHFINQKQQFQAQSRVIASNVRRFYRRALQELNVDPRRNDGTWKCWQKIWWIVNNHFGDAKRQILCPEDVLKIFGNEGGECLFWKAAENDLWNKTLPSALESNVASKTDLDKLFSRWWRHGFLKREKKSVQAFKRSIFIH